MQKQRITNVTAVTAFTTVALFTLAACGTESGSGSSSDSGPGSGSSSGSGSGSVQTDVPLTGVHWSVDSLTVGGKKTAAPAGASVEIDTKGRASARTGCNTIGADVTIDGDTITVGQKESTLIGCAEELQAFEKALSDAFSGTLKAQVKEKRLTLTTPEGDAIILTSEPAAPLAGTRWTVNALTQGAVASSLPPGTEGKAHFTFGKDGTVEGSFGCNTFRGTAKITGTGSGSTAETITFGRLSSTRKLCPGPEMTLERQIQKVLEGEVTYELRHRALTVKKPDAPANGTGLAAVAAATGK
ncbi:META domain-containing protein [Streptomyces odonnellii]|uniref:META domain-containing protein n=1 Tax=Streptomyces odonnellii TaxID=1417980 RepID=UPI0006260BB4|nr:META domain-containing protein [Streptomyces odonnellii]